MRVRVRGAGAGQIVASDGGGHLRVIDQRTEQGFDHLALVHAGGERLVSLLQTLESGRQPGTLLDDRAMFWQRQPGHDGEPLVSGFECRLVCLNQAERIGNVLHFLVELCGLSRQVG